MKKLFIAIVILLASVNISYSSCDWTGNIGSTSSLTDANINECINEASALSGEVTINLSAGTLATTATYTINMSSGFANVTSLRIFGAGTVPTGSTRGSAGSTVFNRGTGTTVMFAVTGSSAKKIRLSNFKMINGGAHYTGYISIYGTSKPSSGGGFRVDHIDFGDSTNRIGRARAVYINGYTYGVVDHNEIHSSYQVFQVFDVTGGNPSWHRAISIGTNDAVYFEDNTATNYDAYKNWMFCDTVSGARVAVRYNTINGFYVGGHDALAQGSRSTFQYEAYNNTIDYISAQSGGDPHIFIRGGTHIIYNNTMLKSGSGSISASGIVMQNDRSMDLPSAAPPWTDDCDSTNVKACLGTSVAPSYPRYSGPLNADAHCDTDADCGGESGSCQYIDGVEDSTGYPCRDQIGMSYTTADGYTHYPSLFWANTYLGADKAPVVRVYGDVTDHIKINRDYCYHATTMPATCNSIATTYSAYDYPHPLTGGGGDSDGTDPVLSAWFPTTEQVCSADPQSINLGITSVDANITTCKWDTSTAAYADLTNTFDGAAAGTAHHTDSASFACGATHTIYYSCQDAADTPNTTDVASWTFSLPALLDETTPVITSVTSSKQAYYTTQKLSVTTSVAGSCRYCVNGVGGCASDTAWASRTAFSVTGGETTHHEVSITQAASSSATYNVICQNTQGTATSTNSAITITTDAAKAITAGTGSLSITQGSGGLSISILP
jgi:hypothetical protein